VRGAFDQAAGRKLVDGGGGGEGVDPDRRCVVRCAEPRRPVRSCWPGATLPLTVAFVLVPHVELRAIFPILIGLCTGGLFSTAVVHGQKYLSGRPCLPSGATLGLALGPGGLLAAELGAPADAIGVSTTVLIVSGLSATALALVLALASAPRPSAMVVA
jgi:FSR family fosmidomycin resistance protein-like MFS transporter